MTPPRRSSRRHAAAGLTLLIAIASVACRGTGSGAGHGAAGYDLLLVTIDTLREDATGFSGSGKVETPTLDRLAAGGRVYPSTHAHAVVTLPSHASILTGLLPYQHGVRDNAGFVLDESHPSLASVLGAAGYATAAFVSAFPLDRRFGLDHGFGEYDDRYEGRGGGAFVFPERPGSETVALARDWWTRHEGSRRFLWVHLFEPHFPYEPGEPFASRYASRPYYGEVAQADAALEPLLGPLLDDPASRTLVVITSDHGEALGDHGELTHGLFAYEATLKVPLAIWAPGPVPPGLDGRPARHIDLVPTVLDLLGIEPPPGLPGRSLLGTDPDEGSATYFEALTSYLNRGWAPLYGRIEEDRKVIDLPVPELYDLEADPAESVNLAGRDPGTLDALLARIPPEAGQPVERDRVDPEVLERLRSLGYVASAGSPADARTTFEEADDPKNLVDVERALHDALTSYREGRTDEAIAVLRGLVRDHSRMSVAYAHLAFMYADLGRFPEAVGVLGDAVAGGLQSETLRRQLALGLLRLGRAEEASAVLSPLRDSEEPETQTALGRVLTMLGRYDEAEARMLRALELDPTFPGAHVDRGILLMTRGRFDEAEGLLRTGLQADAYNAEGWNALGVIQSRRGDLEGAIGSWRQALAVDPRLPDALFNLAVALARSGRFAGAIDALQCYVPLVEGEERRTAERMLADLRRAPSP